jgi:hypothetical protein
MRDHALTLSTAALLGLSGIASYLLIYRFGRVLPGSVQLDKPFLQAR